MAKKQTKASSTKRSDNKPDANAGENTSGYGFFQDIMEVMEDEYQSTGKKPKLSAEDVRLLDSSKNEPSTERQQDKLPFFNQYFDTKNIVSVLTQDFQDEVCPTTSDDPYYETWLKEQNTLQKKRERRIQFLVDLQRISEQVLTKKRKTKSTLVKRIQTFSDDVYNALSKTIYESRHLILSPDEIFNDLLPFIYFEKIFQTSFEQLHDLDNFLDISHLFPLRVEEQQPTEREIMDGIDPSSNSQIVPHAKRSVSDMPHPELAPQASANRKKKPANLRLYEDFLKQVDAAASEIGTTRTAWIEEALTEKLARQRKNTPK